MRYNVFNKPEYINRLGSQVSLYYDANWARYKQTRTVSGTTITTHYIDKMFEVEMKNGETKNTSYISDVAILIEEQDDITIRFTHKDRLGSSATFTDHNGYVTAYRSFDPFGKPKMGDGSLMRNFVMPARLANNLQEPGSELATRRGFTDHEHLDEVEIIHMNGRVYDYNVGRFISVDPFIQGAGNSQAINPYSYVLNNPLAFTDPSGYSRIHGTGGGIYGGSAFGYWNSGQQAHTKTNENNVNGVIKSQQTGTPENIADIQSEVEKRGGKLTQETTNGDGTVTAHFIIPTPSGVVFLVGASTNVNQDPSLGQQGLSLGLDVAPVVGGVKGVAQVFTGEDLITGEKLSRWEEAGYAVLGFFGAKVLAKAGDIADFGEASLKVLRQGDNLPDSVNFKGLVQNRNLQDLTHQDLTKAFDGTGFTLSGHAIYRLKHSITRDLGFGNLNDISKVFNKGARFDAGRGEIGFSYRGLEAIVNPKTNNILTFRPEKPRR